MRIERICYPDGETDVTPVSADLYVGEPADKPNRLILQIGADRYDLSDAVPAIEAAIQKFRAVRMTASERQAAGLVAGGFYAAERSDQGDIFHFKVTDSPHGRVIWGLSRYQGEWGYRTLGISLISWLARPANARIVIVADRDRAAD